MWQCLTCGEECENNFEVCWNCQTKKGEFSAENRPTMRQTTPYTPTLTYLDKLKSRSIPSGVGILVCGALFLFLSSNGGFDRGKKDEAMLFGVFLVGGGVLLLAWGLNHLISTRKTQSSAPTTQPAVNQSISPRSIELGNTPDEVQSVMGNPDKIINLGAQVIHVYKDMKIIYVDGKVSDVQLS